MKLILIPCASGVATSTMAAEKLKDLCRARALEVDVRPVSFKSLSDLAPSADLIVTIAPSDALMDSIESALRQPRTDG